MKLQHETDIDGVHVLASLLDYDEAADISFEIAHKLAPLVQVLAGMDPTTELDDEESMRNVVVPLLVSATQNMKPLEWSNLVRRLLQNVSVTIDVPTKDSTEKRVVQLNTKEGRNLAFRGRPLLSYHIALFVMKINFSDFTDALGQLGLAFKKTKPAS